MPWLCVPPNGCIWTVSTRREPSRESRPSAAGYHSRPPSANPDISTRGRRVPTSASAIVLWA
ncbi:hypothetical protein EMO91_03535 [Bifidobacterium myosotis]|uniref:Uncharacterized protein n=1 Tax=Bifidobacterium myosotis TaxID=1630166 RepID=A0A5M9ZQD8_9BIFI|nr:hypothetical protein EMO91_03535 [Bifidobacterium myosotis]